MMFEYIYYIYSNIYIILRGKNFILFSFENEEIGINSLILNNIHTFVKLILNFICE